MCFCHNWQHLVAEMLLWCTLLIRKIKIEILDQSGFACEKQSGVESCELKCMLINIRVFESLYRKINVSFNALQ
jgi:hypothetical protein